MTEVDRPSQPSPGAPATASIYWWAYPSRVTLFIHFPIFLSCALLDEAAYALFGHHTKFFTGEVLLVGFLALAAFGIASAVNEGGRDIPRREKRIPKSALDTCLIVLFVVVLAANAVFLFPLIQHPELLLNLLSGSPSAMYDLRLSLNRIPGITSFVALQTLIIALVANYRNWTGEPVSRMLMFLTAAVVFVCVLRALAWSERLALIELGLTFVIAVLTRAEPISRLRALGSLTLAPLWGVLGLFAVFAIGEYFRSWQFYQHVFPGSFAEFTSIRFAGYYATALNNGAAFLALHDPLYAPDLTMNWFYKFPLWDFLGEADLPNRFDGAAFLEAYMNPEFNNTSGIYMPLFDFGPLLGILCWSALGAFSGNLFNRFARGDTFGLVMYPVWFTGVVEILRVFYWGETRLFPVLVFGMLIVWYLNRKALSSAIGSQAPGASPHPA